MNSALYAGHVQHRRLRPRLHHLRYSFFWTLLDLDELAEVSRRCRLFSAERFNLFSFYQTDHLGAGGDLRGQIKAMLQQANIPAGGAIRVMCMPRVLGHVFNPISVFFCYDTADSLAAILYEVNNTFGQRHCYLFAVRAGRVISHGCAKEFYVSPFMAMQMRYEFEVTEPAAHQTLKIDGFDDAGLMIATSFAGTRRELSDRVLIGSFLTHPLLTLKVGWDSYRGVTVVAEGRAHRAAAETAGAACNVRAKFKCPRIEQCKLLRSMRERASPRNPGVSDCSPACCPASKKAICGWRCRAAA